MHRWDDRITVVAATALECRALRRRLPNARILETGVALKRLGTDLGDIVVVCGVAGALRDDLPTGTCLIPDSVRRPDGSLLKCDATLAAALAQSARRLGIEPVFDRLLTSDGIVHGKMRAQWAALGFAGVDMETGLIVAPRVAAIRIVLDTPRHELSGDWRKPVLAILKPWNWPQALWLAREAPRAAALAASIVAGSQVISNGLRITGQ